MYHRKSPALGFGVKEPGSAQKESKCEVNLMQIRHSRKQIQSDVSRLNTRIQLLEHKNEKDLLSIVEETRRAERMVTNRFENQ
jgi:hypothetical protein